VLKYTDEDDDLVTIANDADAREAFLFGEDNKKTTLVIHVLQKPRWGRQGRCHGRERRRCHGGNGVFAFPFGEIIRAVSGEDIPPHLREWFGITSDDSAKSSDDDTSSEDKDSTHIETPATQAEATKATKLDSPVNVTQDEAGPSKPNEKVSTKSPYTVNTDSGATLSPIETPEPAPKIVQQQVPAAVAPEVGEDSDIRAKQALLRDMGFNIDDNLSAKLIKEMNGRIDLIVTALVKNFGVRDS